MAEIDQAQSADGEQMIIRWDAPADDFVSVTMKLLHQQGIIRKTQIKAAIGSILVFAVITLLFALTDPLLVWWVLAGGLVATIVEWLITPWLIRKRVCTQFHDQHGTIRLISCEVRLATAATEFRSSILTCEFPLSTLEEIVQDNSGVDLIFEGGWLFIPMRAFTDKVAVKNFIDATRAYSHLGSDNLVNSQNAP